MQKVLKLGFFNNNVIFPIGYCKNSYLLSVVCAENMFINTKHWNMKI